jgi:hypothetical protein
MSRTWKFVANTALALFVAGGLMFGANQLRAGDAMMCLDGSPGLCPPFDTGSCGQWCATNGHTDGACEPAPGGIICCNCWTR